MVRANALRFLGAKGGNYLRGKLTAVASNLAEPIRVRQEPVLSSG
jgi:hypothetical protein